MKLGLGTVQFGQPYGIASRLTVPDKSEVRKILSAAREHGSTVLDTAPAYGAAERLLGEIGVSDWRVVTKVQLPAGIQGRSLFDALEAQLSASLKSLRVSAVYGLLAHRVADFESPNAQILIDWMDSVKRRGLVEKIGASVYSTDQLRMICDRFSPDLVQMPYNLLDQRAVLSGAIADLHTSGVEIHLRSIFLQGLLLMSPAEVPGSLPEAIEPLRKIHACCREWGLEPIDLALMLIKVCVGADVALVGVTSLSEWKEVCRAYERAEPPVHDLVQLAANDERLLNPGKWQTSPT